MNGEIPVIVIAFKTATVAIGGFITYMAAKAARKTGWTGLSYLAIGFGIITFGSLLAGLADQLVFLSTPDALVLENAVTTLGFAVIGYSLYVTR